MTIWTFKLRNGETFCYKQEGEKRKLFLGNDNEPTCFKDLSSEFKPGDMVELYGTIYHVAFGGGMTN